MSITEHTYGVSGMHCGSCALNVRDEVLEVPGVTEVVVDHVTHRMLVAGTGFTDAQIAAAVSEAGYAVVA